MKRLLFVLLTVLIVSGLWGCVHAPVAPRGNEVGASDDDGQPCVQPCARRACCWPPCNACAGGFCREHGGRARAMAPQQPPTAAITYPYYTLRGPRDFLQRNPSPIGP